MRSVTSQSIGTDVSEAVFLEVDAVTMAYILYDPHTADIGTGQRLYLGKDGSSCADLQSARLFATRTQADAAKLGNAARFVAREVFAAQVWEQLVEALRRTWNMLAEQTLQWSSASSMTAEQVRAFMRKYIEDQAPAKITRGRNGGIP